MIRRSSWHYYFFDADQRALQVADWMGEILNWSESEKETQLQRYKKFGNTELPKTSSDNLLHSSK